MNTIIDSKKKKKKKEEEEENYNSHINKWVNTILLLFIPLNPNMPFDEHRTYCYAPLNMNSLETKIGHINDGTN